MTHCFKRATLLSLFLLLAVWPRLHAQSSMTDEQIMEFVITENAKGTSQQQIVTRLMQRGVDIQQIRRIREKYEKEQKGDILGAKDVTGKSTSEKRLRKNNGDERDDKLKNSENYRRRVIQEKEDEPIMSERRRRLLQQRKEDDYVEGLDFVLMDSLKRFDEIMAEGEEEEGIKVFGRNIFNQKLLTFEPNMNIATPSDYRLGPGDAVFVDIWGASQKTITSTVSPEGAIDIEGFGPVQVSGMTVDEANAHLKSTLGKRFVNSEVRLTVGQTRTITVNVMGEVEAPGTYTLSAFATVFHALYMAGGTNDIGTLRDIKVYRDNRLISTVDIYDFILNGRLKGNVRLASNDVIIVGPYDCLVNIAGKVKRPMFYEMKKNESVATLLKYAGGFTGDAYQDYIRLIRKNGGEYSIYTINEFDRTTFQLADGDSLTVDSVLPRFRNMVEIKGAVKRPGMYQMDGKINTVRLLLEHVDGVTEDAFLARAVMHRRKADRTLEVVSLDIDGILKGDVPDVALHNEDVIFIPSLKDAQEERTLTIYGEVVYPGEYQYADNTTIEDFILQAGGLTDAASVMKIDISRRIRDAHATSSSKSIAKTYSLALKDGFVVEGEPGFVLEPFDEVFVRKNPGYSEQQHIVIEGEVTYPGTYTLDSKGQRLSDIVKAAGGLTDEAYASGARLERKLSLAEIETRRQTLLNLMKDDNIDSLSTVKSINISDVQSIGINLDKAIENPGSTEWDVVLEEGDRLIIPQYTSTVTISGEVMYPNTVSYQPGAKLSYYINQAGGYNSRAKRKKVFAVQQNGTVTQVHNAKDIQPGCEIFVPAKPKRRGASITEIVGIGSTTVSLATVIATVLLNK